MSEVTELEHCQNSLARAIETSNHWSDGYTVQYARAKLMADLLERAKEYVQWSQRAGFVQLVSEIDAALMEHTA